ncbi:hypothetical protein AYI69_g9325, partial [Smittium culicis]
MSSKPSLDIFLSLY